MVVSSGLQVMMERSATAVLAWRLGRSAYSAAQSCLRNDCTADANAQKTIITEAWAYETRCVCVEGGGTNQSRGLEPTLGRPNTKGEDPSSTHAMNKRFI